MNGAPDDFTDKRLDPFGVELTDADYRHAAGNLRALVADPADRLTIAGYFFGATAAGLGDLAILRPEVTA